MNVRFSGVINPKPNFNGERKSFLEEENHLLGLIDQTYRFAEDCMTHYKFIKFGEKKIKRRLPNNKFIQEVLKLYICDGSCNHQQTYRCGQ